MSGRGFLLRQLTKKDSSDNDDNSQRNDERPPVSGRGRLLASATSESRTVSSVHMFISQFSYFISAANAIIDCFILHIVCFNLNFLHFSFRYYEIQSDESGVVLPPAPVTGRGRLLAHLNTTQTSRTTTVSRNFYF